MVHEIDEAQHAYVATVLDHTPLARRVADARTALASLDLRQLTPRRGLAGLFDGRTKRLRRFREDYARVRTAIEGCGEALRFHAASDARRLGGSDALTGPDRGHGAALVRAVQNVEERLGVVLSTALAGLDAWYADWNRGLGLDRRRPRSLKADPEALDAARAALDAVLAATEQALTAAATRAGELRRRVGLKPQNAPD